MKYIKYQAKNNSINIGILEENNIYPLDCRDIFDAISQESKIEKEYKNKVALSLYDVKILNPVNPTKVVCGIKL